MSNVIVASSQPQLIETDPDGGRSSFVILTFHVGERCEGTARVYNNGDIHFSARDLHRYHYAVKPKRGPDECLHLFTEGLALKAPDTFKVGGFNCERVKEKVRYARLVAQRYLGEEGGLSLVSVQTRLTHDFEAWARMLASGEWEVNVFYTSTTPKQEVGAKLLVYDDGLVFNGVVARHYPVHEGRNDDIMLSMMADAIQANYEGVLDEAGGEYNDNIVAFIRRLRSEFGYVPAIADREIQS